MAQNIEVTKSQLSAAIAASQAASAAIDTSILPWADQGADSPALDAFARQFHAFEEVMALYQVLLDQDLRAVRSAMNKFEFTDEMLAVGIRNGI